MNNYYTIEPVKIPIPPEEYTNNKMLADAGIHSNWQYRQYMQKNAKELMKYNTMEYINNSGNNPYTLLNNTPVDKVPHLYNSIHDTNNPTIGFRNSDLKQSYLTNVQMKSRMIAPSIYLAPHAPFFK